MTFGSQTLGTGTLVPVSGSNSSALLSLNSFYFSPGANTVTLSYSGDTNYVANSNTQQISLLNPVFGAQTTTVLSTPTTLSVPYTFHPGRYLWTYNYSPVGGSVTDFKDNGVQCYEGSTRLPRWPTSRSPQGTLCIFSVSF